MIGGEFSLKRMEERKISELFLLCLLSLFSEKRKRKILSVEKKEAWYYPLYHQEEKYFIEVNNEVKDWLAVKIDREM